ncbi:MAG: ribosome maturation factor RimM [bacterium]
MGGDRALAVVGKVVKPHGLAGELKVFYYVVEPEYFKQCKTVFVEQCDRTGKWFHIESVRFQHKWILLKFSGVNTRDSAEFFRGSLLYVYREDFENFAEKGYPLLQINGFIVETLSGRKIGVVEDILVGSFQHVIIVRKGKKEVLIPFVKEFVKQIDIQSKRVFINPIEGLLDNAD